MRLCHLSQGRVGVLGIGHLIVFLFRQCNCMPMYAGNVSFSIPVRWSIYIINSIDKPNFRVSLPHRRSTTVSLETNPLYSEDQ